MKLKTSKTIKVTITNDNIKTLLTNNTLQYNINDIKVIINSGGNTVFTTITNTIYLRVKEIKIRKKENQKITILDKNLTKDNLSLQFKLYLHIEFKNN